MKLLATLMMTAAMLGTASAQVRLSIVEGAACAQNAAHIEKLEQYNTDLYDEIGELQSIDDRRAEANALLLHYERMTAYRQGLIADYEVMCSRGTMSVSEFRKVCSPQSSGVSFEDTVFCEPLRNASE